MPADRDPSSLTQTPHPPRSRLRRWLPLAVVVLLAVLVLSMGWHRLLSLETLVANRARIDAFVTAHQLAALALYIVLYIVVVALSVPGAALLTLTGGFLFGTLVGGSAAIVGSATGAVIIFLIARSAAGEFLLRRAGPLAAKLAEGFRADAFNYLLFLRLVPAFPFWLVNLAAALFAVPTATFIAATVIGIVPAGFVFAFAGAGLDSVISAQAAAYKACLGAGGTACRLDFDPRHVLTPELLAALGALAVLALVPVLVKRWRSRRAALPPQ